MGLKMETETVHTVNYGDELSKVRIAGRPENFWITVDRKNRLVRFDWGGIRPHRFFDCAFDDLPLLVRAARRAEDEAGGRACP